MPPWFYSRRRYRRKGFCEYCHASIEDYDSQDSTGSDYYFSEEYKVIHYSFYIKAITFFFHMIYSLLYIDDN